MKALTFTNGNISVVPDYPQPARRPGEALIRVSLAGICATDLEIVKGYMGYEGVLGHEFAGVVEEADNPGLSGRRVAGEINIGCGGCAYCAEGLARHCPQRSVLGILGHDGAFAEYLTLPEGNLHFIPDSVSDEEAVFIEPLAAAFEIVEQVKIRPDDTVCVLGDGRLGLLAAQVLDLYSGSLLAVGRHPEKLALLEARGIKIVMESKLEAGEKFDLVIDCTASAAGLQQAIALVRPRGTIVLKTTIAARESVDLNQLVIDEITLIGSRCGPFAPAIDALAENKVDVKSLIDRIFALDEGAAALDFAAREGVLKVLLRP